MDKKRNFNVSKNDLNCFFAKLFSLRFLSPIKFLSKKKNEFTQTPSRLAQICEFVALVGAVMFGLAIKNNDAEQKQNGLLTMIAGFVVVAITAAVDMFDLFS